MEKTKLVFLGTEEDEELQVYANDRNEIFILVDNGNYAKSVITLDKPTSIKLAKELRKQISYLED